MFFLVDYVSKCDLMFFFLKLDFLMKLASLSLGS